ncbi:MAG: RluA family pseudouridine synthase [Patescibacteria group bacterium]
MAKELIVPQEYAGTRLDVFLAAHFLDFSRSWIQKLIKKGNVSINNKPALPSKKLKTGELINFDLELPPEISLEPDESLGDKIKIIFENDDFLVIDKPSGITAHPASSQPRGTVVNWLLAHYPPIKSVGDNLAAGNTRPGLVHRLDKETSGVMIIAKNQPTFLWLKKQFQQHRVIKKYIALVNGSPEDNSGKIELNIVRSKINPTKNAVTSSKTLGRRALTYWKVLRRFPDHILLEASPKTGRMHQIRVHLKAAGWPVAGDKKYGSPRLDPKHLGRMFLHAEYLSFEAQSGEKFSFNSALPQELEECLKNMPYVVR